MLKLILWHYLILNCICTCGVYACTHVWVSVGMWVLWSAYRTLGVSLYLWSCLRQHPFGSTEYTRQSPSQASGCSYPLPPSSWLGWGETRSIRITDSYYSASFAWTSGSYPGIASALLIEPSPQLNLKLSSNLLSSKECNFFMIGKNVLVFWT